MNLMLKKTISSALVLSLMLSVSSFYSGNVYAMEAATLKEHKEQYNETLFFPDPDADYTSITEGNLVFRLYDEYAVLSDCNDDEITEVVIPEEVNGLPVKGSVDTPFGFCRKLEKITLPDSFEHLDWRNLTCTTIQYVVPNQPADILIPAVSEVVVSDTNPFYCVSDGIVYTKDMKILIGCPPAIKQIEPVISDKAERINDYAFIDCVNLETMIIPDNITHINNAAFLHCINLKSIVFPENLVSISGQMCYYCEKLSDVKLGSAIQVIGFDAFFRCSSLENFDIPETVKYIGYNAFDSSPCTENIGGLHYIDNWLVGSDEDVQIVNVKEGTKGIAENPFFIRKDISLFSIPDSVKYINYYLIAQLRSCASAKIFYRCSFIGEDTVSKAGTTTDYYIYDPECDIFNSENTIPSKYKYKEYVLSDDDFGILIDGKFYSEEYFEKDTVIHGYANSTAEKYADKYNRKFEIIKDVSCDMNADGEFNAADIIQTQKWLMGVYDDCSFNLKAADMNENGTVDIADLCLIKSRLVSGLTGDDDEQDSENGGKDDTMRYTSITMDKAKEIFETPGDYIILDVRRKDEFAEGHIPNAVNIANEDISDTEPAELPDKNQVIYVYCRSGNRSKQAAGKLAAMGYKNIVECGGIIDWKGALEVIDSEE